MKGIMSQHVYSGGPASDAFDRRVADDPTFDQAVQFAVAVDHLWIGTKSRGRYPSRLPRQFPPDLREAILVAAGDYERAVLAGRDLPKNASLSALTQYENRVTEARNLMRYRLYQGLMELNLTLLGDRDGFDVIYAWKSDDAAIKKAP